MKIRINRNTQIIEEGTKAVKHAAGNLIRDIRKALKETEAPGCPIHLVEAAQEEECFQLQAFPDRLEVRASDELGFIYGIYEISRILLGIADFWFWNDQQITPKEEVLLPEDFQYQSRLCSVRFRGWFVNDEVLLHTWRLDGSKDKSWEMVFEALLRCGGNLVIPGTDRNSEHYRRLASDMGLYITHHHAEPLGAEMFARAYPQLNPSYREHPDKFHQLWEAALEKQKGMKVIWNLGFRGQGDCPFWVNDPQYKTDEARGVLMGRLIKMQYDLVKKADPQALCCTNLYGETMELYQRGCLELPADVIKIWADNGYGKMVSRRQDNHNPRIPAMPERGNQEHNGIYYHASFYDLQTANHITMLPNSPEFVKRELNEVMECNGGDFWIINCSNVKPHVYILDLIAKMWRDGALDVEEHRKDYVRQYYGGDNVDAVTACLKNYFRYAPAYGSREDEHAGEQFSNHVPRMLISQYMRDGKERAEDLLWAVERTTLREQILWYRNLCRETVNGYGEYLQQCERAFHEISDRGRSLFRDSLLLQARIHNHCYRGALRVCESLLFALDTEYQKAFYEAGKARKEYLEADAAMRACEHDQWKGFYANECLTDIKQTAWVLEGLMSFVRNMGDGPHYYQWQREFLYSEEDRRVLLILNMENHLKDQELFELMERRNG